MTEDRLISAKEVAMFLGRSESYVDAMKVAGFKFVAGRTTKAAVIRFLTIHPNPCAEANRLRQKKQR